MSITRAPLPRTRTGTMDHTDGYKSRMIQMRDDLRNEAVTALKSNPEYDYIQKYIDAIEGRYYPKDYPRWRSRFVDHRMAEARNDSIAYMTDLRPTINISTKVGMFQGQTDIFHHLFDHEWKRLRMPIVLAQLQDHANFGSAFLKVGGVAPGFLTMKACGMDSVLPIQRGDTFQESRAVLYRTYRSLEWLVQTFGKEYYDILKNKATSMAYGTITSNQYTRPGHVGEYTWNSMSPAMRHHIGRSLKIDGNGPHSKGAFPTFELEEFWIDDPAVNESRDVMRIKHPHLSTDQHNYWYDVKPRQRLWPNKRLVVWASDVLLYDGPSPYWHGMFPFGEYTPDPVVWAPGGFSFYRPLLPMAESINRVGASFEDATEKALNQTIMMKENSFSDQSISSFDARRPGSKLRARSMANLAQDVRFGPVAEIPGYAGTWEDKLHARFDRRRGTIDIQQLGKKKQVPSGETFEQMRESQSAPFRLKSAYLEACLEDICPMAMANFSQFFTMEQRIRILGPDGVTWQDFDFDPGSIAPYSSPQNQHWRNFLVDLEPGSMLGSSQERKQLKAMAAYNSGVISLRELHRQLELPNSAQILKELAEEHQAGLGHVAPQRSPRATRGQRNGKSV